MRGARRLGTCSFLVAWPIVAFTVGCGARTGLRDLERLPASAACQPSGGPQSIALAGTIRDFTPAHPDFESFIGDDPGIVAETLGADGKPVYTGIDGNPSTHGPEAFAAWYHDVPNTNLAESHDLTLASGDDPTVLSYEDDAFFPIDGELFGNEGRDHNYHFTYEVHAEFERLGGEVLTFGGDDDLFAFVGGRLVIDLGGVHGEQQDVLELDDVADEIGLAPGAIVPLDLFFAERHTTRSTFRLVLQSFAVCE